MKKNILLALLLLSLSLPVPAQIPLNTHIQILKAEDERRYDKTLEDFMRSPIADVRKRAALAAGRIGRDEALAALVELMETDKSYAVRTIAAFAVGEIESVKGSDAILRALSLPPPVAAHGGTPSSRPVESSQPVADEPANESNVGIPTRRDSPTEAYRRLYAAVKSKDIAAIKSIITRKTIDLGAESAKRFNKPLDSAYENGFTATTFASSLPEIRDERVKDTMGAVEVWNSHEAKWEDLPFMLEDGQWRLAIGELFDNTYRSPGRGRDSLEREAGTLARWVEAAGKIAAANATDPKAKELGRAILAILETESTKDGMGNRAVVLFALTAVLRARPENGDKTVAKFLIHGNSRIRADAANTLSRLRAKNANEVLQKTLASDIDPFVRANAARALGAAEDKDAVEVLTNAALKDADSRVRVSAIRALGAIREPRAAEQLISRGRELVKVYAPRQPYGSSPVRPAEKSELLEIVSALGQLLPNTEDSRAVTFINQFRLADRFRSAESEIALARIAPRAYVAAETPQTPARLAYSDRRVASAYAQGMEIIAASKDESLRLNAAQKLTAYIAGMAAGVKPSYQSEMLKAMPDLQQANAAFKPDNLGEILRNLLKNEDVNVRATAAGLIGAQPKSKENLDALNAAFSRALVMDSASDDAQLAILGALNRLDKKEGVDSFLLALNSPNYLIRRRAFQLLGDADLQKAFPGIPATLENAKKGRKDQVLRYSPATGTKLGQVINTDADYARALSRKNGSVKAVLTTEKGAFTIDFYPEEAPLTVDNFIKLARSGYFNGVEVHRVVPNFVMQDGDPRGDGNGGPGWSIRCEVNMLMYERGMVGMALSGKDTGGSQWFVTHSPQPHLDGGYTIFGKVNEAGMKVVDNIVRGDKVLTVRIVGR